MIGPPYSSRTCGYATIIMMVTLVGPVIETNSSRERDEEIPTCIQSLILVFSSHSKSKNTIREVENLRNSVRIDY